MFNNLLHLLLPALSAASIVYLVYLFANLFIIKRWRSSLSSLRGPDNDSLIMGNFKSILLADPAVMHEAWEKQYGRVFVYRTFLSACRLCTTDPAAISHMLTQAADDYPRPLEMRQGLASVLGEGLLWVEGDTHKRQRSIMSRSFGTPQIREVTPIFFDKARRESKLAGRLCDILLQQISTSPSASGFVTDILQWTSRTTLDIIGHAGFGYQFDSLENRENELSAAASRLFAGGANINVFNILKNFIPLLKFIPDRSEQGRIRKAALATMKRIGTQLIANKKHAVIQGTVEKDYGKGRDLLSVLVRANMSVDLRESQKMSDEEVLAQISTFLIAGHETTSTAVTWCLYALSNHPAVLAKLRSEVLNVQSDTLPMDDLNALPYLDAVVREVLRLYTPVPNTLRVAGADGFLPVSEPYVDRKGKTQTSIRIVKGDTIFIPIRLMARSTRIWGEDAHEFRPERWSSSIPDAARDMPSIFSNLPTFISGPRACIGYKFAVIEMKAIIFTFLRKIDFEHADPTQKIGERTSMVTRPFLVSRPKEGNQLPLRLRALQDLGS